MITGPEDGRALRLERVLALDSVSNCDFSVFQDPGRKVLQSGMASSSDGQGGSMFPVRRVTGFPDRSRLSLRLGSTLLQCFLATCLAGCTSEAKKWETVRQTDVIQEYEAFVQKYPDGEHVAEARERLAALMESRDWRKAETEDSVEALRSFLQAYPSSLQ
jgi:hypothetical protein